MSLFDRNTRDFFTQVVDRVLGTTPAPAPVVDKRLQNLAQKRMNIRAVGVREGFQAMRARSEQMAQRLEAFKRQRAHEPAEPVESRNESDEPVETIVLSSRT